MRMNALIPMQAQGVDVVGSMARGAQARGQMQQAQTQNALTQFMQEQGPALARGEQGAIDGYARFDPAGAFDMRSRINEAARVAQEQAAAAAEKLDAQQRAAEEANINRILSIVGAAYRQGPEAIEAARAQYGQALAQANIDPTQLTYDTIPLFVAGLVGAKNGLKAGLDASEALQPKNPDWRAASPEEAARYGAQAGQINDKTGEFKRTPLDSGLSVETGPDGQLRIAQGPGVTQTKPFTEGQSKDNVYSTRARGALEMLEPVADSLVGRTEGALEYVPLGLGREMQGDDYQVARQAGTEFLQAILRKDTGAAITIQEEESYGRVYLPQPGDGQAVLEAKRQARIRAVNAIEAGMSPAQMLVRDRALINGARESGQARMDEQTGAGVAPEQPPAYLSEQDRGLWEYMTPQERAAIMGSYPEAQQ